MTYYQYAAEIVNGNFNVAAHPGFTLSGLSSGHYYAISSTGGPWHAPFGNFYHLQLDGGTAILQEDLLDSLGDHGHNRIFFQASGTTQQISVADGAGPFGDNTGSLSWSLHWAFNDSTVVYCNYGTEPNPDATQYVILTSAIVDAAIFVAGGGVLLATAFDTVIGTPLLLSDMCAHPPPPFPTFTADDFILGTQIWSPASLPKRMSWLKTALWTLYCQCVPAPTGSPPPVPEPQPVVDPTTPAAGGTLLPVVCDPGEICSLLNNIQRQVNGLSQMLNWLTTDVRLIQRQGVPFGYIEGTVHAGLTGTGHFTVADILGLSVSYTTVPARFVPRPGDPTVYYRLGWVNVGTADGWQRAWETTHNPYLVLPIGGEITTVGYDLADDAIATITELVREP